MKFVIRNFEIDIKAKNLGLGEDRNNKDAVMTFLNEVCIWMYESADYTAFQSRNDDGYYDDKPDAVELGKKRERYSARTRMSYTNSSELWDVTTDNL